MTHTYLKRSRTNDEAHDYYEVGQWLINSNGYHQFQVLFWVPSLSQALTAINHLNGGTRVAIEALHLTEPQR